MKISGHRCSMIKISTITPCYNMERYLKLFLEELPKQTMFNEMEVVLDHNDPTDQELLWVKEFQEKHPGRLKHLITTPVVPIGISMNKCIKESSGEYLCIWNVDDLRTPKSIEYQINQLDNDYDISCGSFIITNQFGATFGKHIDVSNDSKKDLITNGAMYVGPFFAFKKSLLEKSEHFDEQLKSGADYDLAMRLALSSEKEIGYIPQIMGYYLDEGKGASTNGDGKQPIERTLIEMRYKLNHKIDSSLVPHVHQRNYDVDNITCYGQKISIQKFLINK